MDNAPEELPGDMSFWRRLFGSNPSESLRPQRLDYLNEALALERQGDYEAALTSYRLALRDHPTDPKILQNMAIAYTKTGLTDEAIRHYRRALELDPNLVGAHYGMAFLLMKKGESRAGRLAPACVPGPPAAGDRRRALDQARRGDSATAGGGQRRGRAVSARRRTGRRTGRGAGVLIGALWLAGCSSAQRQPDEVIVAPGHGPRPSR